LFITKEYKIEERNKAEQVIDVMEKQRNEKTQENIDRGV